MANVRLHIEKQYSSSGMTTYIVEGLSVDEMDEILNAPDFDSKRSALSKILDSHDNDMSNANLGTCWYCGYGIYEIRHFGGHLIVSVGNSCD